MEAIQGEKDESYRHGKSEEDAVSDPDDDQLYCLSYVSTQSQSLGNADLLVLLEHAREKNTRLGLTGLLLHRGGSFFQVLEGGYKQVISLYKVIATDTRHQRVEVVSEGPISSREYTEWQMGFVELDGQNFSAMPGFSDILKQTPEARDFLHSLSRSKKLALLFSVMD
ncbi:MAG: BLUF domain-containing protein [Congregibacter sp.]